jgi:hypothetical protein
VRERGVPPSFNVIEVDDVDIRITALAFERTQFVTFRTWSVPRRCVPRTPNENGATEVAPLKV